MPLFWLLCSLLLGVAVAFVLYHKVKRWTPQQRLVLGTLRTLGCAGIVYLLLAPVFTYRVWQTEKPIFLVAWDDSRSMRCCVDSSALYPVLGALKAGIKQWSDAQDVALFSYFLGKNPENDAQHITFDAPQTDLGALLADASSMQADAYVAGMLLISDGMYNHGLSPEQVPVPYPVHVLGVGDTLPQRDVVLENVFYNRVAYQGNDMLVEVLISHYGYSGVDAQVMLTDARGTVRRQTIQLPLQGLATARFVLPANKMGTHRYRVRVTPLGGEVSKENNYKSAFIRVVKDKIQLVLIAPYPHPDIGALQQSIAKLPYYQCEVVILRANQRMKPKKRYDVALIYDAFATDRQKIYAQLQATNTPIWWFFTPRSQPQLFLSQGAHAWPIQAAPGGALQANPGVNSEVSIFTTHLPLAAHVAVYPPLNIPALDLEKKATLHTLLFKKKEKKNIATPLWMAGLWKGRRTAFSLGAGFWRWRLQEAATYDTTHFFDKLVAGTLQYLSTQANKQRFHTYPVKPLIATHEQPIFRTEYHDASFVPRYGHTVALSLRKGKHWARTYTYVHDNKHALFQVPLLAAGTYTYRARLQEGTENLFSTGKLYVEQKNVEALQTQADYPLLRRIAHQSGGHFFAWQQYAQLLDYLHTLQPTKRRYQQTNTRPLIGLLWLLPVLLGVLVAEWALRKRWGGV